MLSARRQILLLGWDFDARIRFKDDSCEDEGPEELGAFISWLTRRTPALNVYILRWDTGAIKTLFQAQNLLRLAKWARSPQVHLRLDSHHPIGASHHQKVLVIDDQVAFCGGIDVTNGRWDTRDHLDGDARRTNPNGRAYDPWHDVTTVIEGPAAAALGDLARERWKVAGYSILPQPSCDSLSWPTGIDPDFTDVELGIARTIPEHGDQAAVHEIEALYVDMIKHARRWIYAESQYFASRRIASAIAARLSEPDGPEVMVIQPTTSEGWLQPIAMDTARVRLVEALRRLDTHHRLRLYHPFTEAGEPIYVHAKMMVVDDDILRVGSSNFNNRSMRLDTECDVAILASDDADRTTIAGIRNAMLAEHLGVDCQTVEAAIQRSGSLIAAVEELRGSGRSLRPYEMPDVGAAEAWLADNEILDPNGPEEMFEPVAKRAGLLPRSSRASLRKVKAVGPIAAAGAITAAGIVAIIVLERARRRSKPD